MNAEARRPDALPFNPQVMRWAREWRGRSIEDAAVKASVEPQRLQSWESGEAVPTVRQARLLAAYYERPFLEFFLEKLPQLRPVHLVPDFRLHRDAPDPKGDREIQAVQDWAEETRLNALDLFETVGDEVPKVPNEIKATLANNPEVIANEARRLCEFSIEDQIALKSADRGQVPKEIRSAMERLGVLVLKDSALGKYGVRGLTLFAEPLPVVIFGTEAPTAQAFTLAHELGHVCLQQSAISGPPTARGAASDPEKFERWCDEFAGAFLVPSTTLAKIWARPNQSQLQIGDDHLRTLANTFSVSRHAMLIRLVQLGYVDANYYWGMKRAEFLRQEAEYKGGGRPLYYGTRFRNAQGDMYTSLVMEAWGSGKITNHNAAELMGIKSLAHLFDIREHFYA